MDEKSTQHFWALAASWAIAQPGEDRMRAADTLERYVRFLIENAPQTGVGAEDAVRTMCVTFFKDHAGWYIDSQGANFSGPVVNYEGVFKHSFVIFPVGPNSYSSRADIFFEDGVPLKLGIERGPTIQRTLGSSLESS